MARSDQKALPKARVLGVIRDHGPISSSEIRERLNLDATTLRYTLSRLRKAELVKAEGTGAKSKWSATLD